MQVEGVIIGPVTLALGDRTVTLLAVSLFDATPRIATGFAFAGHLGQDVLRRLGTVTNDFDRHMLAAAP